MAKLKVRAFEAVFSTDWVQVNRMVLAPGEEVPWHFHDHVRDTFYVLCGQRSSNYTELSKSS